MPVTLFLSLSLSIRYQGSTHLTRGQEMQKALEAMAGGVPATQNFNYVPGVSHE